MVANEIAIGYFASLWDLLLTDEIDGVSGHDAITNSLGKTAKLVSNCFPPDILVGAIEELVHGLLLAIFVEDVIDGMKLWLQ